MSKLKSFGSFVWLSLSFAFFLFAMLLAVTVFVVPQQMDAVPLTIVTGSMKPTLEPGTMVIVKPVDSNDLLIGDVVTFQPTADDPSLVTHRVVSISKSSDGTATLVTQGDNNNSVDDPIKGEQVMGEVVYAVPYFGWVTTKLNSDSGKQVTQYVAYGFLAYGAAIMLSGVLSPLRKRARRIDSSESATDLIEDEQVSDAVPHRTQHANPNKEASHYVAYAVLAYDAATMLRGVASPRKRRR